MKALLTLWDSSIACRWALRQSCIPLLSEEAAGAMSDGKFHSRKNDKCNSYYFSLKKQFLLCFFGVSDLDANDVEEDSFFRFFLLWSSPDRSDIKAVKGMLVSSPRHDVHSVLVIFPSEAMSQYRQKCLAQTLFLANLFTLCLNKRNSRRFKIPFLKRKTLPHFQFVQKMWKNKEE